MHGHLVRACPDPSWRTVSLRHIFASLLSILPASVVGALPRSPARCISLVIARCMLPLAMSLPANDAPASFVDVFHPLPHTPCRLSSPASAPAIMCDACCCPPEITKHTIFTAWPLLESTSSQPCASAKSSSVPAVGLHDAALSCNAERQHVAMQTPQSQLP